MDRKPVRITDLRRKKQAGEKITMLTAYDTPTARLLMRPDSTRCWWATRSGW